MADSRRSGREKAVRSGHGGGAAPTDKAGEAEDGGAGASYDILAIVRDNKFPPAAVVRMASSDLTMSYIRETGFRQPIVFEEHEYLGLKVPPKSFTVRDVERYVGPEQVIDVVDVSTQDALQMTMKEWRTYYETPERTHLYNVISLEVSHCALGAMLQGPAILACIDWTQTVWPHDRRQQGDPTSPVQTQAFPKVQKYCLMSVAGCYTDFHIDFGGSSVWYHVLHGEKIFFLVPPTPDNLARFERWTKGSQADVFFGDMCRGECGVVRVRAGDTLLLPSGWIHAVYTPDDALVFGANFLHGFNIDMQLAIDKLERRLKVPSRYKFPLYEELLWYAGDKYAERMVRFVERRHMADVMTTHELTGLRDLAAQLRIWASIQPHRRLVPETIQDPDMLVEKLEFLLSLEWDLYCVSGYVLPAGTYLDQRFVTPRTAAPHANTKAARTQARAQAQALQVSQPKTPQPLPQQPQQQQQQQRSVAQAAGAAGGTVAPKRKELDDGGSGVDSDAESYSRIPAIREAIAKKSPRMTQQEITRAAKAQWQSMNELTRSAFRGMFGKTGAAKPTAAASSSTGADDRGSKYARPSWRPPVNHIMRAMIEKDREKEREAKQRISQAADAFKRIQQQQQQQQRQEKRQAAAGTREAKPRAIKSANTSELYSIPGLSAPAPPEPSYGYLDEADDGDAYAAFSPSAYTSAATTSSTSSTSTSSTSASAQSYYQQQRQHTSSTSGVPVKQQSSTSVMEDILSGGAPRPIHNTPFHATFPAQPARSAAAFPVPVVAPQSSYPVSSYPVSSYPVSSYPVSSYPTSTFPAPSFLPSSYPAPLSGYGAPDARAGITHPMLVHPQVHPQSPAAYQQPHQAPPHQQQHPSQPQRAPHGPSWLALPDDIWLAILRYLSQAELRTCMSVCRAMYRQCSRRELWETMQLQNIIVDKRCVARVCALAPRALNLSWASINDNDLWEILSVCSGLRKLDLTGCANVRNIDAILASNFTHCMFEEIRLAFLPCVTNTTLNCLVKYGSTLQSLALCGAHALSESNFLSLVPACKHLRLLDLYRCSGVTDIVIEKIVKVCTSLQFLDLRGTSITNASLARLTELASLKTVDLRDCVHIAQDQRALWELKE